MKDYKDLVQTIKTIQSSHIMDCTEQAICDYQDMIGHSSIEQLEELANGAFIDTFYKVYGLAYGTGEAIKFYCQHSDKIKSLKDDLEKTERESNRFQKMFNDIHEEHQKTVQTCYETELKAHDLEVENTKLNKEIIKLKAKLYDLMTK